LRLAEAFSARNGNAASGILEKGDIAGKTFHDFIHAIIGSAEVEGLCLADIGAFSAIVAKDSFDSRKLNPVSRTCLLELTGCNDSIRACVQAMPAQLQSKALDLQPVQFA
jgi:hypothetical protein